VNNPVFVRIRTPEILVPYFVQNKNVVFNMFKAVFQFFILLQQVEDFWGSGFAPSELVEGQPRSNYSIVGKGDFKAV
jgi:hypothetical protein